MVLQAVSVEAIEEYCDACEEEILAALSSGGEGPYYLRPRFSPGYGDLPLEFQREFLQILETPKKIGVTLTDSLLMMPSKSVTAIIGISREDSHCIRQGCESCAHTGLRTSAQLERGQRRRQDRHHEWKNVKAASGTDVASGMTARGKWRIAPIQAGWGQTGEMADTKDKKESKPTGGK